MDELNDFNQFKYVFFLITLHNHHCHFNMDYMDIKDSSLHLYVKSVTIFLFTLILLQFNIFASISIKMSFLLFYFFVPVPNHCSHHRGEFLPVLLHGGGPAVEL